MHLLREDTLKIIMSYGHFKTTHFYKVKILSEE